MTSTNGFVYGVFTRHDVLPRARAIYLARILCRDDIVRHLLQNGRNVRTGQLPAHMRAVFVATERAMLGLRPGANVPNATRRHDQTGVTRAQRVFVWAAGVDAYLAAARLAGLQPSERDLMAYHQASLSFGRLFGVDGNAHVAVGQTETLAARLLSRITPTSVLPGGSASLAQVTTADWFRSDSSITDVEVIKAVEETMPSGLMAALRR